MCTSLIFTDNSGRPYFGRTLELTVSLPYEVAFFPRGVKCTSQTSGYPAVEFERTHDIIAITMPDRLPTPEAPLGPDDMKVIEGMNDAGLTFSLLSYPAAGGQQSLDPAKPTLSASDLGGWILGSFTTVAEVRAALEKQQVKLESLAVLGGVVSPFHYVAHDRTGDSLVIEFDNGVMKLFDNPVGVMTNGPSFDWHLTNLNNYTFLNNVDRSTGTFGKLKVVQPDSGIATEGLPSSSTAVGRFVRAAYYAQFTEKADDPDTSIVVLAHIMNNFDRPRGVSIDYPTEGASHMEVPGLSEKSDKPYATEFTSWTSMSDLSRTLFFVRDYGSLNYIRIDLAALAGLNAPRIVPLAKLAQAQGDVTEILRGAA